MCTPFTTTICLFELNVTQSNSEKKNMSLVPCACAIRSLMYVMVCTRKNLAQAVSVVSRYMGKPGKEH